MEKLYSRSKLQHEKLSYHLLPSESSLFKKIQVPEAIFPPSLAVTGITRVNEGIYSNCSLITLILIEVPPFTQKIKKRKIHSLHL